MTLVVAKRRPQEFPKTEVGGLPAAAGSALAGLLNRHAKTNHSRHRSLIYGQIRTDRDGEVMVRVRDNRLDVTCWNDLALKRIDIRDGAAWAWLENEKKNWNRLFIRSGVF